MTFTIEFKSLLNDVTEYVTDEERPTEPMLACAEAPTEPMMLVMQSVAWEVEL